jgi:hypothetical protein
VNTIQVDCTNARKLEELQNKHVTATGTLDHREGVETAEQPVFKVSSIKEVKVPGEALCRLEPPVQAAVL